MKLIQKIYLIILERKRMARILLNKDNLFYNLETISQKATSKEKVAVVLKDNAYGHGIVEIAKTIM